MDKGHNLLMRLLSGIPLAALALCIVLFAPIEVFVATVLLISGLAQHEFYQMTLAEQPTWLRLLAIVFGSGLIASAALDHVGTAALAFLHGSALVFPISQMTRLKDAKEAINATALLCWGLVYIPGLLSTIILLQLLPHEGSLWTILALALTWGNDAGAYAIGRLIGRRRLSAKLSPGKTIEGAIGGSAAATSVVALIKVFLLPRLTWIDILAISLPGSALGIVGDLAESMIKRASAVKNSGKIIPGHGGMLDRLDALLFVAPYVYLYANLIGGS